MTDIFHEVQEDLRRDRMKALWDRYGTIVVILAALIVAGVGGWRGYQYFQARAAADAGDRYMAATRLSAEGKQDEARKAFAAIAADAPAGYKTLATLRQADELAKTDKAAALKLYQAVVDDAAADGSLKDAARVRGAYVAVDAGSLQDVKTVLGPLANPGRPWSALADEALGLAAFKAGDMTEARKRFEAIVSTPDAPGNTRQRADLMLSVLPPADAPKADAPKP